MLSAGWSPANVLKYSHVELLQPIALSQSCKPTSECFVRLNSASAAAVP